MRDRGQYLVPGAVIPPPATTVPPPPPPPTGRRPLPARVQQEIDQLVDELLAALLHYRTAKRMYATRTAQLEQKHGPTAKADIAARDDYVRARAESECRWWRGEVMAASNALLALRSLDGGGPR